MAKKSKGKTVTGRVLHDPVKDRLRPIYPLDLSKVRTIDDQFYEDVMAGAKGAAFPMGRRARESATLPDD